MHRLGVGAALLLTATLAWAKPPLESVLGPTAAVPSRGERVDYRPRETPRAEDLGSPDALARDPAALVAFLEANPNRLDVKQMPPPLVMTIAQILADRGKLFVAEKLLTEGATQWADRPDLKRALGRILIRLGRPNGARRALTKAVALAPTDAESHYLLGRATIRCEPFTGARQAEAIKAFETVLSLDPEFTDGQVTASELGAQLKSLKRRRGLGATPAGAR